MNLRTQKFNGKIYGKAGAFSIYVNNNKVEVSDEDVNAYNAYIAEYEKVKKSFPEVLTAREVQIIAVENGWEKEYVELNLEQLKLKLKNFKVDFYEKLHNGVTIKLQVASFKGENIVGYVSYSNGKTMFIYGENIIKAISQIA